MKTRYTQLEQSILDYFNNNLPSTFESFQQMVKIQKLIELNFKERNKKQSTYYRSK